MKYILSHCLLFFFLIAFTAACGKSKCNMAELHSSSCLEYLLWSVVIILGVVICLLLIGYCYSYRKDKKFGLAVAESEPDKITVELLQKQLDSESIQTEPEPIQTDPETLYNNPDIVDKCMAMERELKQYKLILSIKKDFPDMKEADIRSLSVFQSLQKKPVRLSLVPRKIGSCSSYGWI